MADTLSEVSGRLHRLEERSEGLKQFYYRQKGREDQLLERRNQLERQIGELSRHTRLLSQVRGLLQKVSELSREESRKRVEAMVTHSLRYIFGGEMEFRIEIGEVRGKPEAEFFIEEKAENGDLLRVKPQEAKGGGVVDVVSLALRIALLESEHQRAGGPLILDEPAKHVSDEYIAQVGDFLKQVGQRFNRQVIMITHHPLMSEMADRSFRIELRNGESAVAEGIPPGDFRS